MRTVDPPQAPWAPPVEMYPEPAPSRPMLVSRRRWRVMEAAVWLMLLGTVVSTAIALWALSRPDQPAAAPASPGASAPPASAAHRIPTAREVAAAKLEACRSWDAADRALYEARHPFVLDPGSTVALAHSEAVTAIEVAWLRQHTREEAPVGVSIPINDYLAATLDVAAADAHGTVGEANQAAVRTRSAATQIETACK